VTHNFVAIIRYDLTRIDVTAEQLHVLNDKKLIHYCCGCTISTGKPVFHPNGWLVGIRSTSSKVPEIEAALGFTPSPLYQTPTRSVP